jgi:WhiB family redox-sensing transcriptional regulator
MSNSNTFLDAYGATGDLLWLDDTACAGEPPDIFFVEAGHALDPATRDMCRGCPVRKHCVTWAYANNTMAGYSGGLSPSQRRTMSLEEALRFIERDVLGTQVNA